MPQTPDQGRIPGCVQRRGRAETVLEYADLLAGQGLGEAYEILRNHANDASTRAFNVRNQEKRDGQHKG